MESKEEERNREMGVLITRNHRESWPVGDPSPPNDWKLSFGFYFHSPDMWNVMEKGPAADDQTESEQFRTFWGEKSELRRFQDGHICEAVH